MAEQTKRVSPEETAEQYEYMRRVRALHKGEPRAFVETFGCQQNEADSERLSGMLCEMGYTLSDSAENVDLVLINTCAIREHAELKALSITGQYKHLREKNPNLVLAVCGCMVTQMHRTEDIKRKYPYVNVLFGTSMLYRFPEILYAHLTTKKRVFYPGDTDGGVICEGLPTARKNKLQAWVSIMYGCNNFCTYCVVPYVRGRECSRRAADILAEVRALVADGCKELTLLGQNVNSYGKDLPECYDFSDLLSDICRIEGDFTVRFMTSHPKDATDKLIDTIAANPKIARQFHLPLQSGSDAILRAMNRHYDSATYLSFVARLRAKVPNIGLTTDIIVGFPGETEADFAATLDVLSKVRFDNIYSFLYSRRPGTPADRMDTQVPEDVKKERFARLLDLQNEISRSRNADCIGTVLSVFVEGVSKTDKTKLTARTEWARTVHFVGDVALIGKYVQVQITEVETHAMYGVLVAEK